MKFLFVCRGNVGRSQIAEGIFRKLVGDKYEISSAGTKLSGPEQPIGELAGTDNVITVMREDGIDISKNIRKQLTKEMANSSDRIILAVDENDSLPGYLLNNTKVTRWNVIDPKGQSVGFTRNVRDQIKDLIDQLIKSLS